MGRIQKLSWLFGFFWLPSYSVGFVLTGPIVNSVSRLADKTFYHPSSPLRQLFLVPTQKRPCILLSASAELEDDKLVVLEDVVRRLKNQKEELQSQVDETRQQMRNYQRAEEEREIEWNRKLESLKKELKFSRKELCETQTRMKSEQTLARHKEKEIEDKQEQRMRALRDEKADFQKIISQSTKELEAIRQKSSSREFSLRQRLEDEQKKLMSLQKLYEALRDEVKEAKATDNEATEIAKAAVAAADRREARVRNELRELRDEKKRMDLELAEMQQDLQEALSAKEQLDLHIKESKSINNQNLSDEIAQKDVEIVKLQDEIQCFKSKNVPQSVDSRHRRRDAAVRDKVIEVKGILSKQPEREHNDILEDDESTQHPSPERPSSGRRDRRRRSNHSRPSLWRRIRNKLG